MSKLQYKTRGMSNPQGKARVYFCCHPKDFEPYFEALSDEVLNLYNCAIWYDEEPEEAYEKENLFDSLGEMNLFLVPVTTRFLTQENRAREVEFAFAREKHIPILPLMQESGLETLFNERCGDLHTLNKEANEKDPTALPYEEKFKQFLAQVLVGDEMREKIRKAFDAYIFLSYRKKDRKHAQELMHLIHQDDIFRDVAIWYDEFLVPGENFNDAIEAAMNRCELLTLAVTPNLVNEPNYVQSVEYPEAVKKGKSVLPVELVGLSEEQRQELQEQYPGIPETSSGKKDSLLSHRLKEALQDIALQEHAGDAEHDFFIGLAYLSGIDVERDPERGRSLLEGASKNGLKKATEKLAEMYHTGDSVERDYDKAIEWREVLTEQWKADWEAEPTRYNGYKYFVSLMYFESLIKLGDSWQAVGRLANAEKSYETARLCAKESGHRRNLSVSLERLGNIREGMGRLEEAYEYYEESLSIRRELMKENGTIQSADNLGRSYYFCANTYVASGKYQKAVSYYKNARYIFERLYKQTGNPMYQKFCKIIDDKMTGLCNS